MDVLEERKILGFYWEWKPTSSSQKSVHSYPENLTSSFSCPNIFLSFLFSGTWSVYTCLTGPDYFISHHNSGIDFFKAKIQHPWKNAE
jgi:hypothetical protein